MKSFYNFTAVKMNGQEVSMEDYRGKVVLIVNTASKCGFTPQFEGLEELYKKFHHQGVEILGFPCNQFAAQDAGTNEEIEAFCKMNYGVTFTMFQKIDVNGDDAHPLYKWLRAEKHGLFGDKIKWNFTKFLLDRDGEVIARFAPSTEPEKMSEAIENVL
ncbi:MAG: glutathione peroxidase [Streptococcaceae bacterium]|jgi:glutathione peroxidase|nr:glutathione peroxidase [Streptococcaceae bacterium]